jgi:hypothetical protein
MTCQEGPEGEGEEVFACRPEETRRGPALPTHRRLGAGRAWTTHCQGVGSLGHKRRGRSGCRGVISRLWYQKRGGRVHGKNSVIMSRIPQMRDCW